MHKRIVAVEQPPAGRGHIHAFLHLLEQQPVFLFRRTPLRDIANNVDRPLLLASLLRIRGSRDHGKSAEARVRPFADFIAAPRAVRTSRPLAQPVRQNRFAGASDHVRRRQLHLLQQNLVGLDDAEIRVVRQDDVVHRVERIPPLPLRTQRLLQQTEVLNRDPQLPPAGFQKLQFLGRQFSRPSAAQNQQPDRRFFSQHRHHHHKLQLF